MLASELIQKLQAMVTAHGDRNVVVQPNNCIALEVYQVCHADFENDDGTFVLDEEVPDNARPTGQGNETFVITTFGEAELLVP